ncbi:MAG TPA: hypothetical protein VIV15_04725 [Anaerolineales bacterium]
MTIELKGLRITCAVTMSMAGVLVSGESARADEATQRAEIAKWAGSYHTEGFLKEPAVCGLFNHRRKQVE